MVTPVPVPTQAAARDAALADLRAGISGWRGDPSDPLYYAAEYIASREILIKQLINTSARGLLFGTAEGDDLTALLALYLSRDGRTDAEFRTAAREFVRTRSGTTPLTVRALARNTPNVTVSDADFIRTPGNTGQIDLYVQGANYTRSTSALRTAVSMYMNSDNIKDVDIDYTVLRETRIPYTLNGIITTRSDASIETIRRDAAAQGTTALADRRRLGASVRNSALVNALWVDGMETLTLTIARTQEQPSGWSKVAHNTSLGDNQFRTQGNTTADRLKLEFKPTGDLDIAPTDNVTISNGTITFTGTNVSAAKWGSETLEITLTSATWNSNTIRDAWTTSTGTGFTITISRGAGDLLAVQNVVPVGLLGTRWVVHPSGTTAPAAGPLTP